METWLLVDGFMAVGKDRDQRGGRRSGRAVWDDAQFDTTNRNNSTAYRTRPGKRNSGDLAMSANIEN